MTEKHEALTIEALQLCILINSETECGAAHALRPKPDSVVLKIYSLKEIGPNYDELFYIPVFLDPMDNTDETIERAFNTFKTYALKLLKEENPASYERIKDKYEK